MLNRLQNIGRQWKAKLDEKLDPGSPPARLLRGGSIHETNLENTLADTISKAFAANRGAHIAIEYRQLAPLSVTLEDDINRLKNSFDLETDVAAVGATLAEIIERASTIRLYLQEDISMTDNTLYLLGSMGGYDPRIGAELAAYSSYNYETLSVVRSMYNARAKLIGLFDLERNAAHNAGQMVRNVRISLKNLKTGTEDVYLTMDKLVAEAQTAHSAFVGYKQAFPVHVDDPVLVFNELFGAQFEVYVTINGLFTVFEHENGKRNELITAASGQIADMKKYVVELAKIN